MSTPGDDASTDQTDSSASGEGSEGSDHGGPGISDDQLPEDLQPTDDNPLAKPPSDDDGEGDDGAPASPDLPDMGDPGTAG